MMPRANPGEVWIVDLGLAAKVRPCLVLSDYPRDDELALVIAVPHTTAVRNNRWELSIPKPFLKTGVFHLQQLQSIPVVRLQRRIGELADVELRILRSKLSELLHLAPPVI
jgi:mRNA interferase MazF